MVMLIFLAPSLIVTHTQYIKKVNVIAKYGDVLFLVLFR